MAAETAGKTVVFTALAGLNDRWDSQPELRQRMRDHGRLLLPKPDSDGRPEAPISAVPKTVENAKYNALVLSPLLQLMKEDRQAVPCIETLQSELGKLHQAHGLNPSWKVLNDEAWSVRYLFGAVKNTIWKKSPPRVPLPALLVHVLWCVWEILALAFAGP